MSERKITKIPATPPRFKLSKTGIYCRVSTLNREQLRSISAQVSELTKTVLNSYQWQLVDIYLDFESGLSADDRPELQRLLEDVRNGKIDTVLTKSVSRLGRNTVDILNIIRSLRDMNARIIFELEEIDTSRIENEFLITLIECYAQEESYNRSENIKWGIKKGCMDGTSKLYSRKCFGYRKNSDGNLEIYPEEAEIVILIYTLYLQGNSILSIRRELEKRNIPSPTRKPKWCNQAIVKILTNEKYIGNVILGKSFTDGFPDRKRKKNSGEKEQYLVERLHPEIISHEMFEAVQIEMERRTNVSVDENGTKQRAKKRYSSKSVGKEEN